MEKSQNCFSGRGEWHKMGQGGAIWDVLIVGGHSLAGKDSGGHGGRLQR